MSGKGAQTREMIVSAASKLFYHKGYGATSYGDIGAETGLGKGNIHYYFKAKELMLTAVVQHRLAKITRQLADWDATTRDPRQRLLGFVQMQIDSAGTLAQYGCPMGTLNTELGKQEAVLQACARTMFEEYFQWLEVNLTPLSKPQEARQNAETMLVIAQGMSLLAHSYRDADIIQRQGARLRQFVTGLGR